MSECLDPDELCARMHLIAAAGHRAAAARHEMAAAAVAASKSLRQLADAWNAGIARDVAEHPDLAALNLQMDGFYGEPPL